jgi:hypothetical protein
MKLPEENQLTTGQCLPAPVCSRCADHGKLYRIWDNIDNIMHAMRPRYVASASMDGRYPCWVVWLPKEGKAERKTLKDALIAFVDQSAEFHSENTKLSDAMRSE